MSVTEDDARGRLRLWMSHSRDYRSHPVGGYRYSLLAPACRSIWVRALFPDAVSARDRVTRMDDCVLNFLAVRIPELLR